MKELCFKAILLCFCLLLGFNAFAYDAEIDGIYYDFSGDEATVTYQNYQNYTYKSDYSGPVVVPENVTYDNKIYSVTAIGGYAFSGCRELTSITIPNSVTSIGEYAFEGCVSLTAVYITDLAAWCNISFEIGFNNVNDYNYSQPLLYAHHLYLNGEEITDLVIPENVTSIGNGAFGQCSGLTSISIPKSVTTIGNDAFSGCSGVISLNIAHGVTSIGIRAFSGCTGLTSVTIPNSITSISSEAFRYCI